MWSIPVSDLIERLNSLGVHRVGLQFPDGLKRRAFEVARSLREAGFEVLISGDPCYGACDLALDTLAMADILVHFGHAPVEERDGVIYEYVHLDIDPAILDGALKLLRGNRVGLVTTIQHAHLIPEITAYLRKSGVDAVVRQGGPRTPFPGQILGCSFAAARNTGAEEILYVGTGMFHPLGVALATGTRTIALDPYTGNAEVVDVRGLLKKRMVIVENSRSLENFGILVSLKSGQQRLEYARHLEGLCDRAYLVMIREIEPDALLNLGFACYVNTACPRLAYDDQIRFPAPVLSPPEFEILCGVRTWDEFVIDEIT
jgi:2-(3-amino-3-carboxypropyl)histidine synthase